MSTTDDSYVVPHTPSDTKPISLKEKWWHIMDSWKIGIIPLPLFVLSGALIAIDCLGGKLPSDIVVMVATLAFFGFACVTRVNSYRCTPCHVQGITSFRRRSGKRLKKWYSSLLFAFRRANE